MLLFFFVLILTCTVYFFMQMKKLTSDIELVKEAIKESAYLQMDETLTKMRPNMKRCIVILREVPESTSVEVRNRALFEKNSFK